MYGEEKLTFIRTLKNLLLKLLKYHLVGSHKYYSNENNDELDLEEERELRVNYCISQSLKGLFFCFSIILYMERQTRTLALIQCTQTKGKRYTLGIPQTENSAFVYLEYS